MVFCLTRDVAGCTVTTGIPTPTPAWLKQSLLMLICLTLRMCAGGGAGAAGRGRQAVPRSLSDFPESGPAAGLGRHSNLNGADNIAARQAARAAPPPQPSPRIQPADLLALLNANINQQPTNLVVTCQPILNLLPQLRCD